MTRRKQQERVRSQFALPDGYPCQMIQLNLSISILFSLTAMLEGHVGALIYAFQGWRSASGKEQGVTKLSNLFTGRNPQTVGIIIELFKS